LFWHPVVSAGACVLSAVLNEWMRCVCLCVLHELLADSFSISTTWVFRQRAKLGVTLQEKSQTKSCGPLQKWQHLH